MPKKLVTALTAGSLALGIAACGGSGSSSSSSSAAAGAAPATSSTAAATTSSAAGTASAGASRHLAIAANPGGALKFDKSSLSAKAGKVTITFTNKAPEGHNFTLESSGGHKIGATPTFEGGSKTLTVSLKPGKYMYMCTVPGHAMGGMMGTLTVT
jgi:plastocyanin